MKNRPKNVLKETKLNTVKISEDTFGSYVDKTGNRHIIKRFTWKNQNKIEIQVITFGARITSIKLPDRKGSIDDIVLGCDNLEGYIQYEDLYMGATIGRTTSFIANGTFQLDKKQYWLTLNKGGHHYNGGLEGFDKAVWIPTLNGTKLILSHVFNDGDEGYPGDLFARITFELLPENELVINMEALTTKPTIINLTNSLYFNLGGHGSGVKEINNHLISINANCYLPMKKEGDLPVGDIQSVVYTENDFQIPAVLGTSLKKPNSTFDIHFCVNKGVDQGNCFIARAMHPPSGRLLEIYSNQFGVHFHTISDILENSVTLASPKCNFEENDNMFSFLDKLHEYVTETMSLDANTDYSEITKLIRDLHKNKVVIEAENTDSQGEDINDENEYWFSPLQIKYLQGMYATAVGIPNILEFQVLANMIQRVLNSAKVKSDFEDLSADSTIINDEEIKIKETSSQELTKKFSEEAKKRTRSNQNVIPESYKDGKIHGKNNAIYKRNCAICFQSENYPNSISHPDFPKSELRPGETYSHTIMYKFWLQAGNYSRWIKRNCNSKM